MNLRIQPRSSRQNGSCRQGIAIGAMVCALWLCWPAPGEAQETWYYHTIHSSSLSALYGRTYKLTYAYQLSRLRQLKISGNYVFDKFTNGPDRVKADIYNINIQFQYHVLHFGRVFLSPHVGAGGYTLRAGNLVDQRFKERSLNLIMGLQGEYYLRQGNLAVVFDYDALYLPFSDLYEFLHLPRVGVVWVF